MKRPAYIVTLRPLPGWPTSADQRLRAFLKAALRAYGLRAVRVSVCLPEDIKCK